MNVETLRETERMLEVSADMGRRDEYPEYKNSGVGWIGSIPSKWTVSRVKHLGRIRYGLGEPPALLEGGLPFIRATDVHRGTIRGESIQRIDPRDVPWQRAVTLTPDDILVVRSGAYTGDSAIVPEEWAGAIAGYDMVFRAAACESRFMAYVLLSKYMLEGQIHLARMRAAQPHLNAEELGSFLVVLPPCDEQRVIADFLDRETAKIDKLVAKKERLIELLQEKRTALITQAVTKGLNPDAPMKDSGIEWLGSVPAEWSVAPLYARYSVDLGKMLDAKRITGQCLLPYLRNIDVQWDNVHCDELPEMDVSPNEHERFTLRNGDLLVCEGGEVGRCAIWRGELELCGYQKAIHRLRPKHPDEQPRFLFYVFRFAASTGIFVAAGNPNTISHLTAEKLRRYRFAFPRSSEQRAIVHCLDEETAKLDRLIARIRIAVVTLREYRTALISAAVTGKIDVRNEVLA